MSLNNITLKTYEHGYAIYAESVKLRTGILLAPLGHSETVSEYDFPEKTSILVPFSEKV
ncbi:MAG: hypothetical protein U5N26_00485 [Candidatus Marinimicrobia bacterium]|nr:hypothetical protein [Candidatus Neomarinimicrobiota bacterium]